MIRVVVNDDNTSDNYSDKTLKKCEKLQNELPPDDQSECSRGLVVHSYSPFTQCLCTAMNWNVVLLMKCSDGDALVGCTGHIALDGLGQLHRRQLCGGTLVVQPGNHASCIA